MSRSYKKHPISKDGGKSKKYGKHRASKKVRRSELSGGKSNDYKKCFERWDIFDFRFYREKDLDMSEDDLNWWKKWYYRK